MTRIITRKRLMAVVYLGMVVVIGALGYRIFDHLRTSKPFHYTRYYTVVVSGNVDRPGTYRVPAGTTQYEILRVAGMRLTSAFPYAMLAGELEKNDSISVGTRARPASLNPAQPVARLEFFTGEMSVIAPDGKTRQPQVGMMVDNGNRLQTDARSQSEVSLGSFSRIDIDNFSEVGFDTVGLALGEGVISSVEHRSGSAWYKVVYSEKSEVFRVRAGLANLTVGGSGADFVIESVSDRVRIHVTDGLVLAERPDGGEVINVIAGQTVNAYKDNRPFQVTRLSMEISPGERFAQLTKEKGDYLSRFMPLNFMFCALPDVFYFVTIRFQDGTFNIVRLPGETSVQQFAQGINTLSEALLLGGTSYATTVTEQMLGTRINNYSIMTRDDIVRMVTTLGGITLKVDDKTAGYLRIKAGEQKLGGEQVIKFMSPAISGPGESKQRQEQVIKAIFDGMRNRNIVLSATVASSLITNVQTNFSANDIMSNYGKFSSRGTWEFKTFTLPGKLTVADGRSLFEPDLDAARKLFIKEGS